MITKEKLKIFQEFDGDVDQWVFFGSKREHSIMQDADWSLIESLLQDILIVRRGLASEKYAENLKIRLRENCDRLETIGLLEQLAI